jgi:hypothetical protein
MPVRSGLGDESDLHTLPQRNEKLTHISQSSARFLDLETRSLRTSDDDHFALGTFSIDEELVIRNRGGHALEGQRCAVSYN